MQSKVDRFFDKVALPQHLHDCWEWAGAKDPDGYGRFHSEGNAQLAHRVSWQLHRGSIPEGLGVCHHCDNPPCTNPNHLFLGLQVDNMRDSRLKGRTLGRAGVPLGSSGYRGVRWVERLQKWVVRITREGELKHLGCFTDEKEATEAYQKADQERRLKLKCAA